MLCPQSFQVAPLWIPIQGIHCMQIYGLVEGNHATYPMVPIDVAPGGYMDISDK